MQALAAAGSYAAALEVYRDLRLLLHRELNTEPDAVTTDLFQRIRSEARRRAQPRPAATDDRAAPTHRHGASALTQQLTAVPSHRIPRPLTRLIGREQEVREIRAALARNRLVTLTGAGGV